MEWMMMSALDGSTDGARTSARYVRRRIVHARGVLPTQQRRSSVTTTAAERVHRGGGNGSSQSGNQTLNAIHINEFLVMMVVAAGRTFVVAVGILGCGVVIVVLGWVAEIHLEGVVIYQTYRD